LFNHSGGLSSGFKDDEGILPSIYAYLPGSYRIHDRGSYSPCFCFFVAYDLYDKPLFAGSSANMIYNPKKSYDPDLFDGDENIRQLLAKTGQSAEAGQV